jgi:hypothetical protein
MLPVKFGEQPRGSGPAPSTGWPVRATLEMNELPELDEKRRVLIPLELREPCEEAIEHVANMISVFQGCSRSVMSPVPCVALEHENEEEKKFLHASAGIKCEAASAEFGSRFPIPRNDIRVVSSLSDRLIGVALLAEAYSGGGESSRYRDFVRFFELAFALSSAKISKKLANFLAPAMRYTTQEVHGWMNLRNPYSHADPKRGGFIASATDIRRYLMRMEQACLDVLFNKAEWMNSSTTRRQVWSPDAISTSPTGDLVVKQGTRVPARIRVFDEFDVYPRDLGAIIQSFDSKAMYAKIATR